MSESNQSTPTASRLNSGGALALMGRMLAKLFGLALALLTIGLLLLGVALAVAYPKLPDTSGLTEYRPKLPLRVFSSDGVLLGEFGEERRNFVPIQQIPKVMQDAVLSIEDARFYKHGGVDYLGIIRAGLANLAESRSQGASTSRSQRTSRGSCLSRPRLPPAASGIVDSASRLATGSTSSKPGRKPRLDAAQSSSPGTCARARAPPRRRVASTTTGTLGFRRACTSGSSSP